VALVSRSRWNQFSGQPGLVCRTLVGPTPSAEIRMVWHAENRSAILANFLQTAIELRAQSDHRPAER
jgi:hypothetical protein